jgi:hypothetical protein
LSPTPPDPLLTEDWPVWLAAVLPGFCTYPFASHHQQFWRWVWDITPGDRPEAFIGIWARGGAKSTSAEAACAALGARQKRRYALYVCDTQERADDHVQNVASMLESERVELFYPEVSDRLVGKFGNSKGWRRNRLRCANGFTVDAVGLDTAARGIKIEDQRPDLIVIDDVDGRHDSRATTQKKIETLTQGVIPAGSEDLAILGIQNVIIPDGIFAQLADGRADFLRRRVVSGPIPALENFSVDADGEVHGTATWVGQSVEVCRDQAQDWGLRGFKREAQHLVKDVEGALWKSGQLDALRVTDKLPVDLELVRITVGVDPSAGSGPDSDDTGIIVAGKSESAWCPVCGAIDNGPHAFAMGDYTCHLSPAGWGRRATEAYHDFRADAVLGEKNNGGEMVEHTVKTADATVPYKPVHASRGKKTRAEPVAALSGDPEDPNSWARGRVHVVGHLEGLEGQLTSWVPDSGQDSPDRLDAFVWALTDLLLDVKEPARTGLLVR